MKAIKTYGINGLLEWHGIVSGKGIKMKVDFTNGSVTAYGVAPATFTTKDELTQHIIESSDQFKSGRIRIERSQPIPGAEDPESLGLPMDEPKTGDAEPRELKQVEVSCVDDAKEYLVEHFGVMRGKLRSVKSIKDSALENGIEFVGI